MTTILAELLSGSASNIECGRLTVNIFRQTATGAEIAFCDIGNTSTVVSIQQVKALSEIKSHFSVKKQYNSYDRK